MIGAGLSFVWILVSLILLIYLYAQREPEELLFLKLIGYYLLGGFVLFFMLLPIPVGFIIYWFALHGKSKGNRAVKESAAFWGLGVMIVHVALGFLF
ncbi:hypothetical protein M3223_21745 [Paenibacillus pasadenensis]|uniref:hypothetical protein n=1 Tax=Paenibacillus pasadenensis TaxID=217090 RepID=UPI0020408B44|nr:hypothetical protein [Paenibacillus pasadenensis]MCM3749963.1 hypothetical protein [Paenibacillus pasadenensis]